MNDRLPFELSPKNLTEPALLMAVARLTTERSNAQFILEKHKDFEMAKHLRNALDYIEAMEKTVESQYLYERGFDAMDYKLNWIAAVEAIKANTQLQNKLL